MMRNNSYNTFDNSRISKKCTRRYNLMFKAVSNSIFKTNTPYLTQTKGYIKQMYNIFNESIWLLDFC